jgi:hypothetical protein
MATRIAAHAIIGYKLADANRGVENSQIDDRNNKH